MEKNIHNIKVLNPREAIRKRPCMYIGYLNNKGIFSLLKSILDDIPLTQNSKVYFEYHELSFILKIENIDLTLSHFNELKLRKHTKLQYMYVAICLSFYSKILLKSLDNSILLEHHFKQGKLLVDVAEKKAYKVSHIELEFTLDREIWKEGFRMNTHYILYKVQELAFCSKGIIFEVVYPFQKQQQNAIFYYPNGLQDKTDIRVIDCHDKNYLAFYCDTQIEDIHLEFSLILLSNSVDTAYLKSYVNVHESVEHGTHVNAVIQGIISGMNTFLLQKGLFKKYKVTSKKILNYSILVLQVHLDFPLYADSVKNKLMTKDIIEPISKYVEKYILEELNKDELKSIEALRVFDINWD